MSDEGDYAEQQAEEVEALESIYDEAFRNKTGEGDHADDPRVRFSVSVDIEDFDPIVVDVVLPETYPDVLPELSLDVFANLQSLWYGSEECRAELVAGMLAAGEDFIGMAMTFSMVDALQELVPEIAPKYKLEVAASAYAERDEREDEGEEEEPEMTQEDIHAAATKHMTKKEKRRYNEKLDADGNLPRGHDWVDIISHLSKTGSASDN